MKLASLGTAAKLLDGRIESISILGSDEKVDYSQADDALTLSPLKAELFDVTVVYQVTLAGNGFSISKVPMAEFRCTNPITCDPELSMRDHQMLKVDDAWYMTGTSAPFWSGRNPGARLFVSHDLLDWKHHSWLIDGAALPDDCFYNGRFWAPEIHAAHGRYWLTVNCGHGRDGGTRRMEGHAIVLFVADCVTGPYTLVTRDWPIGKPFKNDASLFTDEDGQTYLYCSGGGLWQLAIDLNAGLRQQPDATLVELRDRLGVSVTPWAVGKALIALKLSYKKSRSARPSSRGPMSPIAGRRGG